jgi:hypothetical protein
MRASYNESKEDRIRDVASEPREVRRYPNRRLYDRRSRSYVALDELRRWIEAGERVRVVDSKTHEDVTIHTLLPLLVEHLSAKLVGSEGALTLHRWLQCGIGDRPARDVVQREVEERSGDAQSLEERLAALERRVEALERR